MPDDPKRIVAAGYDAITESYLRRLVDAGGTRVRDKYLGVISERLEAGTRILELGCGAGRPMTVALTETFEVVGLDISTNQLALARTNAPAAWLLRGDMVHLPFRDGVFAAVAAFYSPTHVPRVEHPALLHEIRRVLGEGGLVVLTMGHGDNPDGMDEDWLGAPMFFSHYAGDANVALVRQAGFTIVSADDETEPEEGVPVTFRWIVATRA